MIRVLALLFTLIAPSLGAQTFVAAGAIRSGTIITASMITPGDTGFIGGVSDAHSLIGQEARVNIYAGRPILPTDIGPPAMVERNAIVLLLYTSGGLLITTEGRALDRAGLGEFVRVMNLSSRVVVVGKVRADGQIEVGTS